MDPVMEFVRMQVALGETPAAKIVEDAVDYMTDDTPRAEVEAAAWPAVADALDDQLAAQAAWPERTDGERLTLAFRDLDRAGIVAREDFACCFNCGHAEIHDEIPEGEEPRGYTFYHRQAAERLARGERGLYLAVVALNAAESADLCAEVVSTLVGHGLEVRWAGDPNDPPVVLLDWSRRRSGHLAAVWRPVDGDDPMIEVAYEGKRQLPTALVAGRHPASRLAALHLPWLPEGVTLRVTAAGRDATVRRDGRRLVADVDGSPVYASLGDGAALLWAVATAEAPPPAVPTPGLVDLTWERSWYSGPGVPYDATGVVDVLRRTPGRTGNFVAAVGASGGVVQAQWKAGHRLWLETPDPVTATSTGRDVTLAEAERMFATLAAEDRVAVDELGGLTTVAW